MLSNPSQVILRNQSLLEEGHWLVANAADSQVFRELNTVNVDGFHYQFDIYQAAAGQQPSAQHTFGPSLSAHHVYDGAIAYMPKAKAQAEMLLANLADCVKPGGTLLLVGDNKAGVKSAAKLLAPFGSQVNKIDAARHCSLFATTIDRDVPHFALADWQRQWTLSMNDCDIELTSLPGVFSHGELDAGTRLLLENIHAMPGKHLLDFACGGGVIGTYLAKKFSGLTVTMSDVSALAVYCAQQTAERNGIKATVVASDGLQHISGTFDAVVTNPPFHTGIHTDYGITETFIAGVRKHLRSNGSLTLVANRFLKYPDLLERQFGQCKTIAQTSKFTLYYCRISG